MLGQRAIEDRIELWRKVGADWRNRCRVVQRQELVDRLVSIGFFGVKGSAARQRLVRDDAERINVGRGADGPWVGPLLWRHVLWRADHHAGHRHVGALRVGRSGSGPRWP